MTNTHLEELLAGQPADVKAEIIRINTEARPIALQIALLVPLLAALLGLFNGFRMTRLPDPSPRRRPRPCSAAERLVARAWSSGPASTFRAEARRPRARVLGYQRQAAGRRAHGCAIPGYSLSASNANSTPEKLERAFEPVANRVLASRVRDARRCGRSSSRSCPSARASSKIESPPRAPRSRTCGAGGTARCCVDPGRLESAGTTRGSAKLSSDEVAARGGAGTGAACRSGAATTRAPARARAVSGTRRRERCRLRVRRSACRRRSAAAPSTTRAGLVEVAALDRYPLVGAEPSLGGEASTSGPYRVCQARLRARRPGRRVNGCSSSARGAVVPGLPRTAGLRFVR